MRAWSVIVRFVWLLGAWLATFPAVQAATVRHVEDGKTVFEFDIPEGWEQRPGNGDEDYVIVDSTGGSMLQVTLGEDSAEAREAAVASTKEQAAENYQNVEWLAPMAVNFRREPGETHLAKATDADGNEIGLVLSFVKLGTDVHLEVWMALLKADEQAKRVDDIFRSLRLPEAPISAAQAQVRDCLYSTGAIKTEITRYYAEHELQFPPANQFRDPEGSRYCAPVTHDDSGQIILTMRTDASVDAEVRGLELQYQPIFTDGFISSWRCSTDAAHSGYLPNGCR